ncbi:MAG: tetratricopeptide repeat-containing glycosyltransferase family protein [Candidatus Babeliales bacterium]
MKQVSTPHAYIASVIFCVLFFAYTFSSQATTTHSKSIDTLIKEIQDNPESALLHYQLGTAYQKKENFDKAVEHLGKAFSLEPSNITYGFNYANALNIQGYELEKALHIYEKLMELNPHNKGLKHNHAYTLKRLSRFHEALCEFTVLLKAHPDYALAGFSRALTLLVLGDLLNGFQEYNKWRFSSHKEAPRSYTQPEWKGDETLKGKTIFVHDEQGLGDTFQFIRYAELLKQAGAYVIAQVHSPLKTLLSLCPYLDQVINRNDILPHFDYHVPLMSLPGIFHTDLDSIPHAIPYLYADESLVNLWRSRLNIDQGFKIGICWQGNAGYSTVALRQVVKEKSLSLDYFKSLLDIPNVSLYSLQKMSGIEQITKREGGFPLTIFTDNFDTSHGRFMDTAAIMKLLDLIITVDTSIAHLAGGLGCKVWLLLPKPADWRWMLNETETPWYPNVRLFRQQERGNWHDVFQQVQEALEEEMEKHNTCNHKICNKEKRVWSYEA